MPFALDVHARRPAWLSTPVVVVGASEGVAPATHAKPPAVRELALCFLLWDRIHHPAAWSAWLRHPRIRVKVHTKDGAAFVRHIASCGLPADEVALWTAALLPPSATVPTQRGDISIVHASNAVFRAAAADFPSAALFALVSGHCVPVRPPEGALAHMDAILNVNPKACIVNETLQGAGGVLHARFRGLLKAGKIKPEHAMQHSQWVALSRAALPVVDTHEWDAYLAPPFFAPDEMFHGTRLRWAGWNTADGSLVTGTLRRPDTWMTFVRWNPDAASPFAGTQFAPQPETQHKTGRSPRTFYGNERDFGTQWQRLQACAPFPWFARKIDPRCPLAALRVAAAAPPPPPPPPPPLSKAPLPPPPACTHRPTLAWGAPRRSTWLRAGVGA